MLTLNISNTDNSSIIINSVKDIQTLDDVRIAVSGVNTRYEKLSFNFDPSFEGYTQKSGFMSYSINTSNEVCKMILCDTKEESITSLKLALLHPTMIAQLPIKLTF